MHRMKRGAGLDTMLAALPHRRGQGRNDECWEWLGAAWWRSPYNGGAATTALRAIWSRWHKKPIPKKAALEARKGCHPLCVRPSHRTLRLMVPAGHHPLTPELRKLLCDLARDGVAEPPRMARLDLLGRPPEWPGWDRL